jgi:hypothetical protein
LTDEGDQNLPSYVDGWMHRLDPTVALGDLMKKLWKEIRLGDPGG